MSVGYDLRTNCFPGLAWHEWCSKKESYVGGRYYNSAAETAYRTSVTSNEGAKDLDVGVGVGGECIVNGYVVTSVHCCGQIPISVLELDHNMLVVAEFPLASKGAVLSTSGGHAHSCGDAIDLEVDMKLVVIFMLEQEGRGNTLAASVEG